MADLLRALASIVGFALVLLALPPVHAQQQVTEDELRVKGGRQLNGADFAKLYIGNTISGPTIEGVLFHTYFESSTRYRVLFEEKEPRRAVESWSVGENGEFCATGAEGVTSCTRDWLHDGVVYSFIKDGTLVSTGRIRPGNPEKL